MRKVVMTVLLVAAWPLFMAYALMAFALRCLLTLASLLLDVWSV